MNEDEKRKLNNLHLAVFGDGNGNKGMKDTLDDIADAMRAWIILGKILKYIFWLVATLTTIIIGWKHLLH